MKRNLPPSLFCLFIVVALVLFPKFAAAERTPLAGQFERGPFILTFTEDSRYQLARGETIAVEGTVQIAGDTLTLRDTSGRMACKAETDVPGRYKWQIDGAVLTLKVIEDTCEGRRNGLTGGPWTRRAERHTMALVGATLIDSTGAPPRPNSVLVVDGGRIVDIFSVGEKPVPSGAAVVTLNGRWIIPGLIDAHVHLATDPEGDDKRAEVERRLERTLLGGVTTVRDMGGDVRVLSDLARSANLQLIPSPAIRYSALVGGPSFFADPRVRASTRGARAGFLPWSRAVELGTDWRLMVAEAKGSGAQGIKLYAALAGNVLPPLVEEAHRQGMRVWGHATLFPARPSDLVAAGVDVLSHAMLLIWETQERMPDYTQRYTADYSKSPAAQLDGMLKDMAARGTMLEPTLFVSSSPGVPAGAARWSGEITRRAHELGVVLVAGTDSMGPAANGELPNLHRELELLVTDGGLTPLEAILAATRNAARALGIEQLYGTLVAGKVADLVVLNADPTVDVGNTKQVACVMRGGRLYATRSARAGEGCEVN